MKIIVALLILRFFWAADFLSEKMAEVSKPLHYICRQSIPAATKWRNLLEAALCGSKLDHGSRDQKQILQQVGLIHLIVVSGSHLILLASFFEKLFKTKTSSLLLLILFLYAGACQFQPPVFRAWISLCLAFWSQRKKWFWNSSQVCWISGTLCLILFPSWATSLSFFLSWLTSYILTLTRSLGWQAVFVNIGLILPLCQLTQNPSLLNALVNLSIAPIWGFFLFPLIILTCVASVLVPLIASPLLFFTEVCLDIFFKFLKWIEPYTRVLSLELEAWNSGPSNAHLQWCWGYFLILTTLLEGLRLKRKYKQWNT